MNNLFQRLSEWLRIKRKPVEFAPRLSREKETAMVKLFDAHTDFLKAPNYENYRRVKQAHFASKEAE